MRYSGLITNDFSAAPGVSVSFFTQGCPHKCFNCQNPETWDFSGGKEFTQEVLTNLLSALAANGIQRNLCIMGGEPLCPENEFLTLLVIKTVKETYPNTPIYIWTGYTYEELLARKDKVSQILKLADVLIDGPYVDNLRDITLPMRGSSNQRVINLQEIDNK